MRGPVGAYLFEHEWRTWSSADARSFAAALREFGVDSLVSESDSLDAVLLDAVRGEGLRWWAAVSLFSDHANGNAVLTSNPELRPVLETGDAREQMEWYIGTIPSDERHTEERLAVIERLVRAHEPDGLILDFARWPLHWELECRPGAPRPLLSSYDEVTLRRFRDEANVDVPDLPAREAAAWIAAHAWSEWLDFRRDVITATVAEAARRARRDSWTAPVGVFTVPLPPRELELLVGQRLSDLGGVVDLVLPMTYHAILQRRPSWISQVVADHQRESGVPAVAVVQVDSTLGASFGADWGAPVTSEEWSAVVAEALASSGCGMIAFPGSELLRPDRGLALRQALQASTGVPR
jgi:hypothetical protein